MGQVSIEVGGRRYRIGCDEGEERHLLLLAEHVGKHVENLTRQFAAASDEERLLMAALLIGDELWDARERLLRAEEALRRQQRPAPAQAASSPSNLPRPPEPTLPRNPPADVAPAVPPVPGEPNKT